MAFVLYAYHIIYVYQLSHNTDNQHYLTEYSLIGVLIKSSSYINDCSFIAAQAALVTILTSTIHACMHQASILLN